VGVDVFRGTAGVVLPPSVTNVVWDRVTTAESIVTRLGTRVDVPAGGTITPTLTSMPEPQWVDETNEKAVGRPTMASVSMKPYTLALIVPFSNQFRRDLPGLYNAIARKLPESIAKKLDKAVFYGPSPGTGFSTLASVQTQAIDATDTYGDYLAALTKVVTGGDGNGDVEAWILSTQAELLALGVLAADGRPLFTNGAADGGAIGNILGRPVFKSKNAYFNPTETGTDTTADTIGFAGPWSEIQYGFVEAISVTVATEATITDGSTSLNLFQRDMFALRVECEVGVAIYDTGSFVRLTGQISQ
jgi:HK97 family phage major capsid protein